MDVSGMMVRILIFALIGAAVGLLAGLLLTAVDVVDNPFWAMSAGMFVGAVLAPARHVLQDLDDMGRPD